MHRRGHVGAALCCYAPVGAALHRGGDPGLAVLGAAVAVALSTVPDTDEYLPIDHRGPTHTVWFVGGATILSAAIGGGAGIAVGRPIAVAATVGAAAALSLTSHLLADSITPMGIRPLYPVSMWYRSFDVTPAADPRANTTMLGAGILFTLVCQGIALAVP